MAKSLARPVAAVKLLHAVTALLPLIVCAVLMIAIMQVQSSWQWIWVLPAVVLAAKAIYALALLVLTPRQPTLEVKEELRHFDHTGNPVNFLHHIESIAQELRYREFPNRIYSRGEPGVV